MKTVWLLQNERIINTLKLIVVSKRYIWWETIYLNDEEWQYNSNKEILNPAVLCSHGFSITHKDLDKCQLSIFGCTDF